MRAPTLILVLGLGASVGVAGASVAHRFVPESPIVRGLFVGERRVPDRGSAAAWLTGRRDTMRARIVHFRGDDQVFDATLGELGVSVDVAATIERAEIVGHQGTLLRRLRESERARRGDIDVPLVWHTDRSKARALLERLAAQLRRAPVDARLDLANRAKIPDVFGRELDIESTIDKLVAARHTDEETIDLSMRSVRASVTVDDLVRVEVDKVLSSYETTFVTYGSGKGRSQNILNAASKIDGIMLGPGESFSFNERVGPRTIERGFRYAPEIQGDETVTGVGGGTCQVSSTLHAAALYGALDVVERQGHSRPSAYTQMGLDATVAYPSTDLKIRNPMSFPVMIHAYLPKGASPPGSVATIRVEILGGTPVAQVEYKYGIGRAEDFTRRIYVKSFLAPGRRIRHQKGTRGYDVTSVVTLRFPDGRVEERRYFSGYRPAPEVFWIAPGYDEAELPPLPEHAKGVEGRMSTWAGIEADTYPM